jgi:hypothetical protein
MSRDLGWVTGQNVNLGWLRQALEMGGYRVTQSRPEVPMLNVSGGGAHANFFVGLVIDEQLIIVGHSWRTRRDQPMSVILKRLNEANGISSLNSFYLGEDGELRVAAKVHLAGRKLSSGDFQDFVRSALAEFNSVMLGTNLMQVLAP